MRKWRESRTALTALSFTAVAAASFAVILIVFNMVMTCEIASSSRKAIEVLVDEYTSDSYLQPLQYMSETEAESYAFDSAEAMPLAEALTEDQSEEQGGISEARAEDGGEDGGKKEDISGARTETEIYLNPVDSEFADSPYYFALSFLTDKNLKPAMVVTPGEMALSRWYAAHRGAPGQIRKASAAGRSYYVTEVQDRFYSDHSEYVWIIYVDVTAQQYMVDRIDRMEVLIMAVCAAIAAFFGFRLGSGFEKEQDRQKKFFENASHELKTPLMSIQGYAEGISSGVIKDAKEASRIIMNETDKMESLVEEILSLSRIESSAVRFAPEWTGIADEVNDCLVEMEYVIRDRKLSVELHLDEAAKVQADPALFERAVNNLLSNAVKYARSKIVISCDRKSLIVQNDGARLTGDQLAHIFDRFYIGPSGSTGIGLALTQEIVRRHGWKIRAQSDESGVRFTVTF